MKMKVIYTPEGASPREWVVDRHNPAWDIVYATEKTTDWPWLPFMERLDGMSGIAWRSLLWTLRKRVEPHLLLDAVEVDWDELDLRVQCYGCEEWVVAQSHECSFVAPDTQAEVEVDDAPKKSKKKAAEPDPEA